MNPDISELTRVIASTGKAVAVSHYSPDGDAVGSTVALSLYLASRGIGVTAVLPSRYADNLAYIVPDNLHTVIYEDDPSAADEAVASADTIFCLDMSGLSRTEYLERQIGESAARKVLIDHHASQDDFPYDVRIVSVETSSTCELLFRCLIQADDIAGDASRLGKPCLDALYSGMITDTNNFNNSVFPTTFEMASLLIAAGVDKTALQENVFSSNTESRMRLQGHMLKDKMTVIPEFNAAFMVLTQAEKDEYNYRDGDSEGFVNLPLTIAGIGISALFTETVKGHIRVSLRSRRGIDVEVFARKYFNGGGHRNAAGGRLYIPVDEVPAYFLKALQSQFPR